MKAKTPRAKVLDAVHLYGNACGEAQWTNGYRAARLRAQAHPPDEADLYRKEMEQWRIASAKWKAVERALSNYLRAATKPRKR